MNISVNDYPFIKKYGVEDGLKRIREAGFEAIDFSSLSSAWDRKVLRKEGVLDTSHVLFKDFETVLAHYKPYIEAVKAAGLSIDLAHAPLSVDFREKPEYQDLYNIVNENCVRLCDYAGVKHLIVHTVNNFYDDPDAPYAEIEELSFNRLKALIPVLKETNVKVCCENLFLRETHKNAGTIPLIATAACCNAVDTARMIDKLNEMVGKDCFAFCLDVGHMNLTGRRFGHFMRFLGRRIEALHIHDNAGLEDQHAAAFSGTVDWDGFIQGLRDIDYNGTINFELSGTPSLAGVYENGKEIERRIKL